MDLRQMKITFVAVLLGVAVGYFLLPHKTKIETREVVKTEIKEVVKVQNHVKTKTVYVKAPNGTETTTTETEDTGTTNIDVATNTETLKEKIVTSNGVSAGIFAIAPINKLTDREYGGIIDIPVASKVSIFLTGDTAKRVGLGVKFQF